MYTHAFLFKTAHPMLKSCKTARELGMECLWLLLITNSLSATVRFAKTAEEYGIKPIYGAEVTLEDGSHLVLLAENAKGYSNLSLILTEAYMSMDWKNITRLLGGRDTNRIKAELGKRRLQPEVHLESSKLIMGNHTYSCMRGAIPYWF